MACLTGRAALIWPGAEIVCEGPAGVALAVLLMTAAGALLLLWQLARSDAPHGRARRLVCAGLGLAAALLLSAAAEGPRLASTSDTRFHLAVVVDLSESVRRAPGRLEAALAEIGRLVEAVRATAVPGDRGSLVLVAARASAVRASVPIGQLSGAVATIDPAAAPGAGASDLEAGVREALRLIGDDRGAILLLSDGLQTDGRLLDAVTVARRRAVAISALPLSSPAPAGGIVAAFLPTQVDAGVPVELRLLLDERSDSAARSLALSVNSASAAPVALPRRGAVELSAVRVPLQFADRGLQHVDLALLDGDGKAHQRRRLFTMVNAPLRIGIAGGGRWIDGVPDLQVTRLAPDRPFEPGEFDAIVIDAVRAEAFAAGRLEAIAGAVAQAGVGLLLVNGAHTGGPEGPTVLQSYEDTPIDPLLPLTSKPRLETVEPPPRQVVILIDASGSMSGSRIATGQAIARTIVRQLSARDLASIVSFSTSADELLPPTRMDPAGRSRAEAALARIAIGGGTDPTDALARAAARVRGECGIFFISDGEFSQGLRQPGCHTTVFAIDQTAITVNREIYRLGEVHLVVPGAGPPAVNLGFFNPPPRKTVWEPGEFVPDDLDPRTAYLTNPPPRLDGTATTYFRAQAERIGARPSTPPLPVLAFADTGVGSAGSFTTAVPPGWAVQAPGALRAWLDRIVSWSARDRYIVELADEGAELRLRVTLAARPGTLVDVDGMSASLVGPSGPVPIRLAPLSDRAQAFEGRLPLFPLATRAMLTLRELGAGALARPQQIPIMLPSARPDLRTAGDREARTYGLDAALLREAAALTGGIFDPRPGEIQRPTAGRRLGAALWPALAVLAGLAHLLLVAAWRLGR